MLAEAHRNRGVEQKTLFSLIPYIYTNKKTKDFHVDTEKRIFKKINYIIF